MVKSEKHLNLTDDEDDGAERRVWTNEEDDAIREMVQKYGTKSWAQISEKLSKECGIVGRSGKQCRERWHNHLDPHINKTNWTEEEERIMSEAHKELGNKWSDIAKRLPGRTDNHVKNHWYSFMRRNVRKLNKQIGKHVSQYATIPVPLQPLPMTYEPQAPTERKGSYNKKPNFSEHIETGPTLSISAVSMKPDEVAMETMFNASSSDGVKVSTSLLDSPSRNADASGEKTYNMDDDENIDGKNEEPTDPILKMIADVAEQRQNAMRGNNLAISSAAAVVPPPVSSAPVAQKAVEIDDSAQIVEESGSATKPQRKKKQSVRKAVNLAELRRYYQAAEEAAREIMVEQYGDAIKETGEEGDAAATSAAPKEDGVYQLSTIGPLPLKSPKRLIALQLANNNPFFRERLKQKLQETATVRNDSDSKYLDDADEKGKRKRGRKKSNSGEGDSSDPGDHVGPEKRQRTPASAVGRVLSGIVNQVAVLNGEDAGVDVADSAADEVVEKSHSNKKYAAGRHGYAEAHIRNDDSAYEYKKGHETITKPPKTKTLKAVVGKVLDKIVNKVIALNNLETARAFTNSSNPNSLSKSKTKRNKSLDGGEDDADGGDDSFDRRTSKLPISKLANKILRNNNNNNNNYSRVRQDHDDEPTSSNFQALHKQLKQQQLEQRQVEKLELDVSRMTKRQIAAAYARNVLLVEQLKEQQRQYQQKEMFARNMNMYGEGDETVIFEGLDGPVHHNINYVMNNRRDSENMASSSSHVHAGDHYYDAAADPFEDSGDSEGDDEQEEEHKNLNSKHSKIKKSQDIYYNRSSKPGGDGSAPKRGRPRKSVEFSAPPKQDKGSSRLSNDSAFSDGSLSPRSLSRRQRQQEEVDSSMESTEYTAFDALTAAVNRESGDIQVKRKRGRPPKEKSGGESSSSGAVRKSGNPFAIPISRNSWGNDAMMMLGVSDSGSYDNNDHKSDGAGGSIIKRRRLGELKIMVDGSATGNSRNNLHSLVGGGINGLNSLGGLNTAGGLSDMGPPDDTPRRSFRLQSNTAANAGMGPLSVNTMFGLDLPSPFALDKGQGMFPDLFGIADTPSNILPFDPLTVKNSGGSGGNISAHSSGGSARSSMGQHPLNGGPDSVRFDFEDVVSKHFPSPRAGEELKGSSPFRWSAGSAGSAPGGMFNFPDTSFPASNSSNNINNNNSSSYSAQNSLDCIADAAIIQQQQQQEHDSQMQEDLYAKKFKKVHRRLKVDSDGPAVIPEAVAAEESGSFKRVAPAELEVDDEQTAELLQSFPIDTPKMLEVSMSLKQDP